MKLTKLGTAAVYSALVNTDVKCRTESRAHSKIMRSLKSNCMIMKDGIAGEFKESGGELELEESTSKYLKDSMMKLIDSGKANGQLIDGYEEVLEVFDKA